MTQPLSYKYRFYRHRSMSGRSVRLPKFMDECRLTHRKPCMRNLFRGLGVLQQSQNAFPVEENPRKYSGLLSERRSCIPSLRCVIRNLDTCLDLCIRLGIQELTRLSSNTRSQFSFCSLATQVLDLFFPWLQQDLSLKDSMPPASESCAQVSLDFFGIGGVVHVGVEATAAANLEEPGYIVTIVTALYVGR